MCYNISLFFSLMQFCLILTWPDRAKCPLWTATTWIGSHNRIWIHTADGCSLSSFSSHLLSSVLHTASMASKLLKFCLVCYFLLLYTCSCCSLCTLQHILCTCITDQPLTRWSVNWFCFFAGIWGHWTSLSSFLTHWGGFSWFVSVFC
jgi:hypothetical protein